MRILLDDVYKKIVNFLNKEKYEYIIIGGLAAGLLGEPRVTGDVDIDILLGDKEILDFLRKAKRAGFKFNSAACKKQALATGTFQINYGDFHIDFIIASIALEKEAFKRKKAVKLYNIKGFFPTPEDLILLKIVPARPQDLLDAQRIVARHKGKLNLEYLRRQAQALSDEAQDARIVTELEKLLKD